MEPQIAQIMQIGIFCVIRAICSSNYADRFNIRCFHYTICELVWLLNKHGVILPYHKLYGLL